MTNLIKATSIIVLLVGYSLVYSATIIVDNNCTLTDALKASGGDISVGACQAGSRIDTIILPANGNYVVPVQKKTSNSFHHNDGGPSPAKSTVIIRG